MGHGPFIRPSADKVGTVKFPRVKLALGAEGVDEGTVGSANALPVASSGAPANYQPGYHPESEGGGAVGTDPAGNQTVRAQVLTDEGSFRANFSGNSLGISIGTCTFTNGGTTVTGTALGTYDIHPGDYVKLDADAESAWIQVASFVSPTELTLSGPYTGTGGTGAALCAIVRPVTGAGGSITVGSGQCTIAAGTTATAIHEVERESDYGPLLFQAGVRISQRIANQDITIGLYDEAHAPTPYYYAWFRATGTTDTTIVCESAQKRDGAPSGAEIESTTATLPNGATTATARRYRIEVMTAKLRFYIDGILVAEHYKVMPRPMDLLTAAVRVVNGTTPATNTDVVVDYMTVKNFNLLDMTMPGETEGVVANQPPLEAFTYNVTGTIAINTDLMVIDCRHFRSLMIACTSMGTSGVVTVQWSGEPTFAAPITATLFSEAGASSTTFNAAVLRYTNVIARYVRLRLTTGASGGTTTVYVHGSQHLNQQWLATQPVSGTVTVTSTRITTNASDGHSTTHHLISAASTNATSVKASAGAIGQITVTNTNAAARYFKLYNKASAPSVGSDTPVMTVLIKPGETTVISGFNGPRLSTGIAYALTTGQAVGDTGAVAANEHAVSIFYT